MPNLRPASLFASSLLSTLLLAPAAPRPAPLEPAAPRCDQDALELAVQAFRAGAQLPGAAVAVFGPEHATLAVTGETTPGGDPLGLESEFHFGSNGKAFTATLLGLLDVEGILSLEASLGETFAPLFAEGAAKIHPGYRDVPVRALLTHQAGLSPLTEDEDWEQLLAAEAGTTSRQAREALARRLLTTPPVVAPGGEPHYSNAGYGIAAAAAELATGRSWEELMREKVWQPLEIDGGFGEPGADRPTAALGHAWGEDGYEREPVEIPMALRPAGDIFFPVTDYVRFVQAHVRGLGGRDTGPLSAELVERLHASSDGYAMGWGVRQIAGEEAHVHLGSAGTQLALVALFPERELGITLVVNGAGGSTEPALIALLKIFVDRLDACSG